MPQQSVGDDSPPNQRCPFLLLLHPYIESIHGKEPIPRIHYLIIYYILGFLHKLSLLILPFSFITQFIKYLL
jgi:hypothetical protein